MKSHLPAARRKKYRIPLRLIELDGSSWHISADVLVNGIPVNVIIDTGASRTVFDSTFPGKGLEILPEPAEGEIRSAGLSDGNLESSLALAESISIGKLELKGLKVILIDLSGISSLYSRVAGRPVHGLLGSDFLLRTGAVIDYGKSVLILQSPEPSEG